jgi:hypothetical protein
MYARQAPTECSRAGSAPKPGGLDGRTRVRRLPNTSSEVPPSQEIGSEIQIGVTSVSTQLRDAREVLRARLATEGIALDHVRAVEAVANEMLGAAFETEVSEPLILRVELSQRFTTIRMRCRRGVALRDEPFRARERVLDGLAACYGAQPCADGSVELWAEVARLDT